MEVAAIKRELRESLLVRRREAPPTAAMGSAATQVLCDTPEYRAANTVAMYVALPDELPTEVLLERARAEGKRVLLPRILVAGEPAFAAFTSFEELRPGRYGVREPAVGSPVVSLSEAGVVVVPGVAFDRLGGRLGHGGGYYDRALARIKGGASFVVGFAASEQVVEELPRERHDVDVDAVATEGELIRMAGK